MNFASDSVFRAVPRDWPERLWPPVLIRSQNGEGSGALPPQPIDPAAEGGPIPVPTAIVAKDNSLVTSINAVVNFTGRTLLSNDSGSILMLGA